MVVFKLDCERPLCMASGNQLFMVQERDVHAIDLDKSLKGNQLGNCRRPPNAMVSGMKSLQYNGFNSTEVNVLVFYSQPENGCYDLFVGPSNINSDTSISPKQGNAQAVCFTARNRFAVLQHSGSIGIYNLQNELSKKFDPPVNTDYIFPGGNNRILLKSEEKIILYDLTARKIVDEAAVPGGVRYVIWSHSGQYVAFMAKHNVLMCGKNLEYFHSFHENIRVKSGAWDENGVFVYATLSHVKYCLPNGDSGIIHSLQTPIYIVRVHKQMMYYIDRELNVQKQRLNCTEYLFKLALHNRKFNDVKTWIAHGRLCGNAVIGYLKNKGFPEVALHFVTDNQTRFNLALEYGHIEEAMTAAQELATPACWNRLGLEALRQGNVQIVEKAYQRTRNFDAVSFLYLITGNLMKLGKMLKIAEKRNDVMSRFNNALMLGSVEERVKVLAEMGQVPLAALTAKAHNLQEFIPKLEEQLQGNDIAVHIPAKSRLMIPPMPMYKAGSGETENWPLLMSTALIFDQRKFEDPSNVPPPMEISGWAEPEDTGVEDDEPGWAEPDATPVDASAWNTELDIGLDLGDLDLGAVEKEETQQKSMELTLGEAYQSKWLKKRKLPCDLVAAGEFEEALGLLRRRLGLINAEPLEPLFKQAYWATCTALTTLPQAPSVSWPLLSEGNFKQRDMAPVIFFNSQLIQERVKEALRLVTAGKFAEALASFRACLQSVPLSCAADGPEEERLTDMVDMCREYVNFCRLETTRKSLDPSQAARTIELTAYGTCCKLEKAHTLLTLNLAMSLSFKNQNFVTAAAFARRIVQGGWGTSDKNKEVVAKARQVERAAEAKASDAHQIRFDVKSAVEEFKLCAGSLTVIGPNDVVIKCPFCGALFTVDYKGKLCPVCELSEIGANTLGLQLRPL
jgi:coatomer protein complex subunit alpha (xenin)